MKLQSLSVKIQQWYGNITKYDALSRMEPEERDFFLRSIVMTVLCAVLLFFMFHFEPDQLLPIEELLEGVTLLMVAGLLLMVWTQYGYYRFKKSRIAARSAKKADIRS